MAVFATEQARELDFRLVRDSFVTMFRSPALLDSATGWLTARGYQVVVLEAGSWRTAADLHRDLARALDFPDHYGENLNALSDCLRDVVAHDYGADPHATGTVLVFQRYDAFAAREPRVAHAVLDILARGAREAALIGHRMLYLVQSDDPHLDFPGVGATPVVWNDAEWPAARRGIALD